MPDMLVNLNRDHSCDALIASLKQEGITIKRAMSPDLYEIVAFVREQFNEKWAGETTKAILNTPASCFIAVKDKQVIGFACYDATARGFFGPTGVLESTRGKGVGKALYLKCLLDMREQGYGYCIVGDAGPVDFYKKTSGAMVIENSWPGVYGNLIGVE